MSKTQNLGRKNKKKEIKPDVKVNKKVEGDEEDESGWTTVNKKTNPTAYKNEQNRAKNELKEYLKAF